MDENMIGPFTIDLSLIFKLIGRFLGSAYVRVYNPHFRGNDI